MAGNKDAVDTPVTGLSYTNDAYTLLVRYEMAKGGSVDVAAVQTVLGGKYKSAWDKVDRAKKTLAAKAGTAAIETPKKRSREETPGPSPQQESGGAEEPARKKISFTLPVKKEAEEYMPLGKKPNGY